MIEIIRKINKFLWLSPTITTWASLLSRTLSLLLILPLILTSFVPSHIALWYLFLSFIGLQSLVDFGFGQSFIRAIAFATGGSTKLAYNDNEEKIEGTNWDLIYKIVQSMRWIYFRISLCGLFLLATLGSLSLISIIEKTPDPFISWFSWAIIIVVSLITMWGRIYINYLTGLNEIALLKRWEAIFGLVAILSNFIVLLIWSNFLYLVLSSQFWFLCNVIRNYMLCRTLKKGEYQKITGNIYHKSIIEIVWPPSWRSGVGVTMSYGIIQLSGILVAQLSTLEATVPYLLGLRFIYFLKEIAQAPFYTRIPTLIKLKSELNYRRLIKHAQKGMRISYFVYVIIFTIIGVFIPTFFNLIGSHVEFIDNTTWIVFGIGFFFERFGAMHIQLYSITNKIIWHIANGISGIIYLLSSLYLYNSIGILSFPMGMLFGYVGFYAWYAAIHSYKEFKIEIFKFEYGTSFLPFTILLLISLYIYIR